MDSDKLDELLRQREAIEEHLRWLDRQIAEAQGTAVSEAETPVAEPEPSETAAPAPPQEIDSPPLPQIDKKNIQRNIARGCAFYIAFAGFLLVILWLVYLLASTNPN